MTQTRQDPKRNKSEGVSKEFIRIIEKNLRKHREILERLAKI